jgi:hypothetical protein
MAPTDYVIKTSFDVGAIPGLGRVEHGISRIDRQITGLGNTLTNKLVAGFAAVASASGLVSLGKQIVGINSELQNAEMGIATLFSALGKMQFGDALGAARGQLKGLRADAAAGVGELSDYLRGFQVILGPASQAGASLGDVRQLTRLSIAAGGAMQGQTGMRLAPLDIVQALRGGIDEKITPFAMLAAQSIGVGKGEFKAMDTGKRVETLIKGFQSFEGAANAFGQTWDAQISTFKDNLKDVARTVTAPLFETWVDALKSANTWLQQNKVLVDSIAGQVSKGALSGQGGLLQNAGGIGAAGAAGVAGAVGVRGAVGIAGLAGAGGWGTVIAGLVGAAFAPITFAISSAVQRWPFLGKMLMRDLGELGMAFAGFGAAVLRLGNNPVVQGFGVLFATLIDNTIQNLTKFVNTMTWVVDQLNLLHGDTILGLAGSAAEAAGYGSTAGRLARERSSFGQGGQFDPRMSRADFDSYVFPNKGLVLPQAPSSYFGSIAKSKPELSGPPVVNIGKVEIKIEAERLDDPNTVAVTMEEVMRRLRANPTSGRGRGLTLKAR